MPQSALYASFDVIPSPKGAAVHIQQMAETLFEHFSGGTLFVLGREGLPRYLKEGETEICRWVSREPNLLARALEFGAGLGRFLERREGRYELCHFRDPWAGTSIVRAQDRHRFSTVYEVNALPSIELAERYPLGARTLEKIRALELECLDAADAVLVPSATLRDCIAGLGTPLTKIRVVPNGADVLPRPARPSDYPNRALVYFGALQPWQGVDVLLRAFRLLGDLDDVALLICSASHARMSKPYRKLAERLEIAGRVRWYYGLPKDELNAILSHATCSIAPLTDCPRNTQQGCCPLKILESMAAGVPVIASDLPCARELIEPGRHGFLVRPDRPSELARAIRVALEYPDRLLEMGAAAREHVSAKFTWQHCREQYKELLGDVGGAATRRPTREARTA